MSQWLVVVDPPGDAPAGIQVDLGKAISHSTRTPNLDFRCIAVIQRSANEQQIAIALHHPQRVLQP